MNPFFASKTLELLGCPADGGILGHVGNGCERISHGQVSCSKCGTTYFLRDGILDLMGEAAGISVESKLGILILRGQVTSYHQKQLAQEAVAKIDGVVQVVNEVEVVD